MASFSTYKPLLLAVEGGYQKLVNDNGNYNSNMELVGTNYGISAPVYEKWIGRVPSEKDMRNIKKSTALDIMKKWYWDIIGASQISNQSIANIIVDHGVNAGVRTAGLLVQRLLVAKFNQDLVIDGIIGAKTRLAINTVPAKEFHDAFLDIRKEQYAKIGGSFYDGWISRLSSFVYKNEKIIKGSSGFFGIIILAVFVYFKSK
tara:strand:+ start:5336 stop:5944 length:609 start_codon:yes stop_codon:yes gene_type:complete